MKYLVKPERLALLDVLRFLAAVMVFVFHIYNAKPEKLTPVINIGGGNSSFCRFLEC